MSWPVLRPWVYLMAIMLSPTAVAGAGIWLPSAGNTSWQSECAACHIAFPAQLLPPSDWRKIMSQLDRHFGTDVSLDSATQQEILDYLQRNGASEPLLNNPQVLPRITSSERFADKHRGAIRLWRKGQIKTLTDCPACHKDSAWDEPKIHRPGFLSVKPRPPFADGHAHRPNRG